MRNAKKVADENINLLKDLISEETPLIGIEVSAVLSFRDEYLDLVNPALKTSAEKISKSTFTFDEFLAKEIQLGKISKDSFTEASQKIKLHGHCQQKAIASTQAALEILSFPKNYSVDEIPSGCCGMAGSFGYEKEHYDLSMKVGELVLFPEIRKEKNGTIICAPGTSCRHQISDGTGKNSLHPVEIMYDALIK